MIIGFLKFWFPVLCWEVSGKNFWLSYGPPNKNGTKKVAAARIKSTLSTLAHIGKTSVVVNMSNMTTPLFESI